MDGVNGMTSRVKNYLREFMPSLPRFGVENDTVRVLLGGFYLVLLVALVVMVIYNFSMTFKKEKFEVLGKSQNHKFYTGARYDSERSDILSAPERFSYDLPFVSVGAVDGSLKNKAELQGLRTTFFDGEIGVSGPTTTEAMLGSLAHGLA